MAIANEFLYHITRIITDNKEQNITMPKMINHFIPNSRLRNEVDVTLLEASNFKFFCR